MFVTRIDKGEQKQNADHFAAGVEQFFRAFSHLTLVDGDQAMAGRQMHIALVTAAAHTFADADHVFGVNQGPRVFMQLLMQAFGLALAEVGQPTFHDRKIFETARHHQAEFAPATGQNGVQHAGTAIDVSAALAVRGGAAHGVLPLNCSAVQIALFCGSEFIRTFVPVRDSSASG